MLMSSITSHHKGYKRLLTSAYLHHINTISVFINFNYALLFLCAEQMAAPSKYFFPL